MPDVNPSIIRKPLSPAPQSTTDQKSPEDVRAFLETISQYNTYGNALKREQTLQEIGAALAQIAEMAETAVMSEAGDWYDAHTLKRNMKEIKGYSSEFMKLATEADTINQRMTALYDDMGRVLERYFEIGSGDDLVEPESPEVQSAEKKGQPTKTQMVGQLPNEGKGAEDDKQLLAEPELPSGNELTIRAIKKMHELLAKESPELAARFRKLPARKMAEAAWKMVR